MPKSQKRTIAAGAASTLVLVGALVSCMSTGRASDQAAVAALLDLAWSYVQQDPTQAEAEAYLALRRLILEQVSPPDAPPRPTKWDAELAKMDATMAMYVATSIYAPAVTSTDIPPIELIE